MKKVAAQNTKLAGSKLALLITAALVLSVTGPAWASAGNKPGDGTTVVPPDGKYHGKTYAEWSGEAVEWALELPLEGHPATDSPDFDITAGQHGNVWFLTGPLGTVERSGTIPKNKALLITIANVDASSLEAPPFYGATEDEQRAIAEFFGDHIQPASLVCTIDGVPVENLDQYRFTSPQVDFTAPSPWLFGEIGGDGTAVAVGYYLLVEPLSRGQHTIHFEALFHFDAGEVPEFGPDALDLPVNMTYHLEVK